MIIIPEPEWKTYPNIVAEESLCAYYGGTDRHEPAALAMTDGEEDDDE